MLKALFYITYLVSERESYTNKMMMIMITGKLLELNKKWVRLHV